MKRLPLSLDVSDKPVLVVGGGAVAERKVRTLLDGGARVTVIAPELTADLAEAAAAGRLTWLAKCWQRGDIKDVMLVFSATDSDDVNRAVAEEAARAGIWCNVASPPEAGTCQVMAQVQRGAVTIALGTDGASPYAARRIREQVEAAVPESWGRLAGLLGEFREAVQARYAEEAARRAAYERMWRSDALARLEDGDEAGARQALRACLE